MEKINLSEISQIQKDMSSVTCGYKLLHLRYVCLTYNTYLVMDHGEIGFWGRGRTKQYKD